MIEETIRVALRIRPLSDSEIAKGCQPCLDCVPNEPQVAVRNTDKAFTFNFVFGPDTSQSYVYHSAVEDLVQQLFKGYNVTILAYGQTGSGKTYSMGTCYSGEGEMGIIPRAISDIYETISKTVDKDFKVTTSFVELYREQLYDLLACSTKPRDQCVVDIREDSKGIRIPGLTEIGVKNAEETIKTLIMGSAGRATGATAMNAQSSRSHAIFTITINMCKKDNGGGDTVAKFHLVDLAGSERPKKTHATGDRFKEGVNINRGLLALGNVISALGDGQQKGYVSYRDSKLTRLLQDSLGGNSMTLMIACVSPADYNCDESISTLRYADRARHIRNKPIVNQDPKAAEIQRLQKELNELRLRLISNGSGTDTCPKEHATLEMDIANLTEKNRKLTDALNRALNDTTTMYEKAHMAELAREKMSTKLAELKSQCSMTIESFNQSCQDTDSDERLAGLRELQSRIHELEDEQKQEEQDILQRDLHSGIASFDTSGEGEDGTVVVPSSTIDLSPQMLAELAQHEEKHTLQQAELNHEFQSLVQALAQKETLAMKLRANVNCIAGQDYEVNKLKLEEQINSLQQERDELAHQLKSAQVNNASSKISEQRRKRLQELETKLSELNKKVLEQNRIIKMKEKSDEKIITLNNEIRSMKATKVRLIREMKRENERFRTWKMEREKELHKLKEQDRRRQNQMTRMEMMHHKQQNVLKRKVEEASAANKRLKEALLLQKQVLDKRQKTGKTERIQTWVERELEVLVSTVEAENIRDKLVEDRAMLSDEFNSLKASVDSAAPGERAVMETEISRLEQDLNIRSAQIADLNQKILDSDQDNKSRTRWEAVQSMVEAKCALKYLFEIVADIKRDAASKSCMVEELQESLRKALMDVEHTEGKLREAEQQHSKNVLSLEEEYEEKVSVLLQQIQEAESCATNKKEKEAQSLGTITKTNFTPMAKPKPKQLAAVQAQYAATPDLFCTDDEDIPDDDENDPDWQKTPIFKQRLQKYRRNTSVSSGDSFQGTVKRGSNGQTACGCKSTCQRGCGCRKSNGECNSNCKCDVRKCTNRSKENDTVSSFSSDIPSEGIKRSRIDSAELCSMEVDSKRVLFPAPPKGKYFAGLEKNSADQNL